MYKNNPKKHSKKPLILGLVSMLILIGSAVVVLEKTGRIDLYSREQPESTETGVVESANPTNTVDYGPAEPSDNQPIPEKSIDTPETTPNNPELGAVITSTRKSSDGQSYLVKVAVVGATSGTCTATMYNDSVKLESTSEITKPAEQYSCNDLSFPMSQVSSSSNWSINVVVTDQDGATSTTSTEVIL